MQTPVPEPAPFTFVPREWPALPGNLPIEEAERRLRARDAIRAQAERAAWMAGERLVRLANAWGETLDVWRLDASKYTPLPTERVIFPSRSAPTGERGGRVLRVTATRALVGFTFKNGRESETWVPLAQVRRPDARPRLGV